MTQTPPLSVSYGLCGTLTRIIGPLLAVVARRNISAFLLVLLSILLSFDLGAASTPVPYTGTPIDSVWLAEQPSLGESLSVFVRFRVESPLVDSVMLHGWAVESGRRSPRVDVRRALHCKIGDTLVGSLDFLFERPGYFEIKLMAMGWYSTDTSGRPTAGSMKTLRLIIPDSGFGQVVSTFPKPVRTKPVTKREGEIITRQGVVITPSGDTLWPIIIPKDSVLPPDSSDSL